VCVCVCVLCCVCVCVCVLRAYSSSFCICVYPAAWLYHPHCNALQRIVICNTSLQRVIMRIAKCCSVLLCVTMCSIYICTYIYTCICIYIYIHICAHAYVHISLDEGVEVNCFLQKQQKISTSRPRLDCPNASRWYSRLHVQNSTLSFLC